MNTALHGRKFVLRVLGAALLLCGLVVSMVLAAPPAGATFPGDNGRIAFMQRDSEGFWQTWVADADLSNQMQLTTESADSGWEVWKPGGAKLAFDSNRADPDPTDSNAINDIFTMNPDGSGVVKLTDSESFNADPGWSPDGSQIAFDSDRARSSGRTEIYVMDSDGTNVSRVTTLPRGAKSDLAPRFSPDGTKLVFTRYRPYRRSALFTVGVDGSDLTRLTPWDKHAGDADWSPDGTKLVFEATPSKKSHGEVFTIDADGEQLTNLTNYHGNGGAADPVWSPDGTKILFQTVMAVDGGFGSGLATMNPDGSDRHFISSDAQENPQEMHQPDWESIP